MPTREFTPTTMVVRNTTSDAVTVYLTLGAVDGCLQNVADIPWITTVQDPLNGSFTLGAGHTVRYEPAENVGLSGQFSFGTVSAGGCPVSPWTTGVNIGEFTINNAFQGTNAQETIDISCVNGVNAYLEWEADGGGSAWNAGPSYPNVTSFSNEALGSNTNLVGVFPANCPGCTTSAGTPPTCSPYAYPSETPSSSAICTVQRPASDGGGTVTLTFTGFVSS